MAATSRLPRNYNGNSGYEATATPPARSRRSTAEYLTLLAATAILIGLAGMQRSPILENHRQLDSSIPDPSPIVIEPPRDCSIPRPEPRMMSPTIIASYPGSGAKMTWKLTRAVTGIMTGDDFNHNGLVSLGQVVGIKTHYPSECCSDPVSFKPLLNVDQSVLLLRHPMNALPSYHNFVYEQEHKLENHST